MSRDFVATLGSFCEQTMAAEALAVSRGDLLEAARLADACVSISAHAFRAARELFHGCEPIQHADGCPPSSLALGSGHPSIPTRRALA